MNNIPPILIKRNEHGLLENQDYIFLPDGKVDWRAMIPKEFLYINPQNKEKITKKYNKSYELLDIVADKVEDKDLVILLAGIRYLATLRNFKEVKYKLINAHEQYVAAQCQIVWEPNYETEGKPIVFESLACAHFGNCHGFGKNYLVELCENRSFCRCVRNFLQISVVSKEELDPANQEENNNSNGDDLQKHLDNLKVLMEERGVKFEQVKERLIKSEIEGAKDFKSINDLPKAQIFDMLERIKKVKKKE